MRGAGTYPTRFEWFEHTLGAADRMNHPADVWTSIGHVWGKVEQAAAAPVEVLDAERAEQKATVTLRNRVGVAEKDRLFDTNWAETWEVTAVRRTPTETVCDVERRPTQVP